MAKRISRKSPEQKLMHKWWVAALLALLFLGASYAFISLAIDSGSWLEYAAGIFFFGWAINRMVGAFGYVRDR
ncbi:MAG: hypothetical protein WD887_01250 [Candidatus Saccharimonadales bacterium]